MDGEVGAYARLFPGIYGRPVRRINDIQGTEILRGAYKNGGVLLTGQATIMRLEVLVRVGTGIAELQRGCNNAAVLLVVAPGWFAIGRLTWLRTTYTLTKVYWTMDPVPFLFIVITDARGKKGGEGLSGETFSTNFVAIRRILSRSKVHAFLQRRRYERYE